MRIRKTSRAKGTMYIILALLFGGLISCCGGFFTFTQGLSTKAEPQRLTLRELGENGYGDNAHVIVTDFYFGEFIVYKEKSAGTRWEQVWVPLVPQDDPFTENILVMVSSTDHPNDASLGELEEQGEIQGIVSVFSGLSSQQKRLLKDKYPNSDFDNVLVLKYGQNYVPASGGLACAGFGVMLFLAAFAVCIFAIFRRRSPPQGPIDAHIVG